MLFVDTANYEEAKKWVQQYGVCKGITTNQKIWSQENNIDFKTRIHQLLKLGYPISIELSKQNCSIQDLIDEAKEYYSIAIEMYSFRTENLAIKVPMWKDGKGLQIAYELKLKGIPVNMTCLMNVNQLMLACEAGATYASLFYRRIADYYAYKYPDSKLNDEHLKKLENADITNLRLAEAQQIIDKCRNFIDKQGYKTKIICGSIREPVDVENCLVAGAHIVTVTPKVLEQMPFHLKTEETIKEFDDAWSQRSQNSLSIKNKQQIDMKNKC